MTNAEYMDVKEAAILLGIGESTLRKRIKLGQIKAYKLGALVRLAKTDIDKLMTSAAQPTQGPKLLTLKDVARLLQTGVQTIRTWIKSGLIDIVRMPSQNGQKVRIRVREEDLVRFINDRQVKQERSSNG